jgi:NAD-dependent DNA ligase
VDSIHFVERRFCFTGKFAYGPRKKCQDAVMARGAIIDDDVTKQTHYLVLGAFVSPDWKHESYGRKIERAHALRGQGGGPLIITEEVWLSALS